MQVKFSISQTSKFLGITTDAIRLYEKEHLIHPKRDENNNYRYYDWEQIRLLMFISFYRKIDVSIPDIRALLTSPTFFDVHKTFDDLIERNREQIIQLNAKIEKLSSLNRTIEDLSKNMGVFTITTMPRGYKMMERLNANTEYKKITGVLSSPMYSFGNIGYKDHFDGNKITTRYMSFIIWESLINVAPIERPISEIPILEQCECVSTVTTGHGNGIVELDIDKATAFIHANGYNHDGYYYAFYVYSLPNGDDITDYYKVYFPIKK